MRKLTIRTMPIAMLAVLGTTIVGCSGSDSNDAVIENQVSSEYSLSNKRCLDNNLNGLCETGEVEITAANAESQSSASPIISNYSDFTLTAQSGSSLVTPFTTLINNEIIFNPLVDGSVDKAKQYLTSKLAIDFSQLDKIDGPKVEAAQIIESLKAANKLNSDNPYISIAAAVEQMIHTGELAVTPTQESVDKLSSSVSIKDVFIINNNDQIGVKTFDLHPTSGRIIMVASNEELFSLNANNGDYSAVSSTSSAANTINQPQKPSPIVVTKSNLSDVRAQDDDDDHDDDDDDDDDDHDWTDNIGNQTVISIKQVVQHQNDENFYLLTSQEQVTSGSVCQTQGDYGAFLSNVNGSKPNATARSQVSQRAVDAYTGATGGGNTTPTPPVTLPPVASSEAACYNTGLIAMAATPDSTTLVIAANEATGQKLYKLNGDKLTLSLDFSYTLENFAQLNTLSISDDGKFAVITDKSQGMLTVVDLTSMSTKHVYRVGQFQLTDAKFIGSEQIAAIQSGTNKAFLFTLTEQALVLADEFNIGHNSTRLAVNNSAVAAVANSSEISVLSSKDNKLSLIKKFDNLGPQIDQLGVLSDKVVYTNGQSSSSYLAIPNQLNYITFGGEMGSPVRLAQKLLTTGLILQNRIGATSWRKGNLVLPTDLTVYGLPGVTVEWTTSAPDVIDVNTGKINGILPANARVNAAITGDFRFEKITINKVFSVL